LQASIPSSEAMNQQSFTPGINYQLTTQAKAKAA
jgi:hypothetical protein